MKRRTSRRKRERSRDEGMRGLFLEDFGQLPQVGRRHNELKGKRFSRGLSQWSNV